MRSPQEISSHIHHLRPSTQTSWHGPQMLSKVTQSEMHLHTLGLGPPETEQNPMQATSQRANGRDSLVLRPPCHSLPPAALCFQPDRLQLSALGLQWWSVPWLGGTLWQFGLLQLGTRGVGYDTAVEAKSAHYVMFHSLRQESPTLLLESYCPIDFSLQPQSNTPEPAIQGVRGYLIIIGRCVGTDVCWMVVLQQQGSKASTTVKGLRHSYISIFMLCTTSGLIHKTQAERIV